MQTNKMQSYEEARRIADIENMGRDYGTAVVIKQGEFYTIKIV